MKRIIFTVLSLISLVSCSNADNIKHSGAEALSSHDAKVLEISQKEVLEISQKGLPEYQIIDVRTPREYEAGHIRTAINIPHGDIMSDVSLLDPFKDKKIILYCRSGRRVSYATSVIIPILFEGLYHLSGDILEWEKNQLPLEIPSKSLY